MDPLEVLSQIWRDAGYPAEALGGLRLTGSEPVLPSSFRVGTAAQVTIAAATLAAAELWRLGTGSLELRTRFQPRSRNAQATAKPMPVDAPVMSTVSFRFDNYLLQKWVYGHPGLGGLAVTGVAGRGCFTTQEKCTG